MNDQLIGTCEHCWQLARLFVVPSGELREPYLCEHCARRHAECGHLIRDGQTTIGLCQMPRGHGGEHMRGIRSNLDRCTPATTEQKAAAGKGGA